MFVGRIIALLGADAARDYETPSLADVRVTLSVSVYCCESVAIDTVRNGELLGWSWLFPPYVWHFTARATKPTTALFFYGTVLREYCEKDHTLGYKLLKRMSEVMTRRLQLARGKLLKTYAANLHPNIRP